MRKVSILFMVLAALFVSACAYFITTTGDASSMAALPLFPMFIGKTRELTGAEVAKLDAASGTGTGPFFSRQLEVIDGRVFLILERDMNYAADIPVNTGLVAPGATSYTWRLMDKVGSMKMIGGSGKDLPTVEVNGEEFTVSVEQFGAQLEYNTREVESARLAGMNIDQQKADALRRASIENKNALAYFGNAKKNKKGLLNDASVTKTVAANGAVGASPLWSTKTALEKYTDIKAMYLRIKAASKGAVNPNRLLMPIEMFEDINTSSFNPDGTNVTVREQVERVLGVKCAGRSECSAAGGGLTVAGVVYNTFLMYESAAQFVEFIVARDLTRHELQVQGLSILVPYDEVIVGTVLRSPVAFDQMYGM